MSPTTTPKAVYWILSSPMKPRAGRYTTVLPPYGSEPSGFRMVPPLTVDCGHSNIAVRWHTRWIVTESFSRSETERGAHRGGLTLMLTVVGGAEPAALL